MPLSDATKAGILRKIDTLYKMGVDNGEAYKLRSWIDALMRIPFGKTIPLPVSLYSGKEACSTFLQNASESMDKAVYGMLPAKLQIQQVLAQWISNPSSVGNVIALRGPMGVGKTSFARNGIAKVLQRPFMFFSLGGASDISNYVGHSYTYEGSIWGQIVDAIMRAGCMNPVFYFDELDKISTTPHGEEITSMLIHLTDRSQNMHYHDRYFAGVDFDLSQCLFVFSFNDESHVHPILKDRMTVIHCTGYSEEEKKIILTKYIWASVLERINIKAELVQLNEEAVSYLIREYSKEEEGVRNLIRAVEAIVTRANLLYVSQRTDYPFYIPISFPMTLTRSMIEKLMTGLAPKEIGSWINMYT
jgi:ATP-dependent Lon protease